MRAVVALAFLGLLLFAATATGEEYALGFGPNPKLPEPERSLVPTVNIAPAKSWAAGATPIAAEGLQVAAFAKDLDHPRWLYALADRRRPRRRNRRAAAARGRQWSQGVVHEASSRKRAGSTRTASPNRITLLRDVDGDGIAEIKLPVPGRAQLALRDGPSWAMLSMSRTRTR